MKSIKQLLFIGLVIMLVLSSCNTKKVFYSFGHPIQSENQNSNKQVLSKHNLKKEIEQNQIGLAEKSANETNIINNSSTIIDDNTTASVDDESIYLHKNEKNNFHLNYKGITTNEEVKNNPLIKSKELINRIKNVSQNTDEEAKMSGMAIAGFICSVVGLVLALITGFPFLLGTSGIVFSAIGLRETLKGKKGKGFAIAGLVIALLAIVIFWSWVVAVNF